MSMVGNPVADMAKMQPPDHQTMLEFCEETQGVLFGDVGKLSDISKS